MSDNTLQSGAVLKAVNVRTARWTVECYKKKLIPHCLYITWQVKTGGGGWDRTWFGSLQWHITLGNQWEMMGGLLTCLAWWALSGWHCCMQHPSTLNQIAKHDQILCPLTSLHQDTPGITVWPVFHNHLPLATGSNALWRSMPYTPFSSFIESVLQERVQKQ